jgi:hypothetical protein
MTLQQKGMKIIERSKPAHNVGLEIRYWNTNRNKGKRYGHFVSSLPDVGNALVLHLADI